MLIIEFPRIITACDYHDFGFLKDVFNEYQAGITPVTQVNFFEIFGTTYRAVFYQGKKTEAETWLKENHPELWKEYNNV